MDDEKLEEKIEELKGYEQEIKDNYFEFLKNCETHEINVHQPESGDSARKNIWISPGNVEKQAKALKAYEKWFSQAEVLVKNYYLTRLEDFRELARNFRERISLQKRAPMDIIQTISAQNANFYQQVSIVESIPKRKKVSSMKFRKEVKESLAKDEVVRAKKLFDEDLTRASGVLAGVALERHLKTMIEELPLNDSEMPEQKISSFAQKLRDEGVLSEDKRKKIVHLSDLRNSCVHAEKKMPDIRDIERMLDDVDDFISRH